MPLCILLHSVLHTGHVPRFLHTCPMSAAIRGASQPYSRGNSSALIPCRPAWYWIAHFALVMKRFCFFSSVRSVIPHLKHALRLRPPPLRRNAPSGHVTPLRQQVRLAFIPAPPPVSPRFRFPSCAVCVHAWRFPLPASAAPSAASGAGRGAG